MTKQAEERRYPRKELDAMMEQIFDGEVHAQRLASLCDGVDGVLHAAQLGIRAIGRGLAAANGLCPKSAIKQVDRLLSKANTLSKQTFALWLRFVLASRQQITVNFDWTEFPDSDHSMLFLGMQTEHGRSTPLLWKTFPTSTLCEQRNEHEDELLLLLSELLPKEISVLVVADRGFADTKLFSFLSQELRMDYIIRIKKNFTVTSEKGEQRSANDWLAASGRMKVLKRPKLTAQEVEVGQFVCVQEEGMKQAWFLASSRQDLKGSEVKKLYGKRFTVEETFRDLKNPRYGLGLKEVNIRKPQRRDVLTWLAVLAHTLLTLLGKAGREAGMEKYLGATRQGELSLFRMGLMLFDLIPRMEQRRLHTLLLHFETLLLGHSSLSELLGVL